MLSLWLRRCCSGKRIAFALVYIATKCQCCEKTNVAVARKLWHISLTEHNGPIHCYGVCIVKVLSVVPYNMHNWEKMKCLCMSEGSRQAWSTNQRWAPNKEILHKHHLTIIFKVKSFESQGSHFYFFAKDTKVSLFSGAQLFALCKREEKKVCRWFMSFIFLGHWSFGGLLFRQSKMDFGSKQCLCSFILASQDGRVTQKNNVNGSTLVEAPLEWRP